MRDGSLAPIPGSSLQAEEVGGREERGLGEARCTGLARKEGGSHRGAEGIHMEGECHKEVEGRIRTAGGSRREVGRSTAADRRDPAGTESRT